MTVRDAVSTLPQGRVRFPRVEFLVVFLPVAIVVVVGSLMFASLNLESRFERMVRSDSEHLTLLRGFIGAEVKGSIQHLKALSGERALVDAVEGASPRRLDAVAAEFVQFANRNPQYQQVRWIDAVGIERVRVTRDGQAVRVTPQRALQDKSERYYVQEVGDLFDGEIYVSAVDLNMEHGRIELPPIPVLRLVTPLFDRDRDRQGALVLNLSLRDLFAVVGSEYRIDGPSEFLLLNDQGVVLNAMGADVTGASLDFASRQVDVWANVRATQTGHLETADGFWTWHRVDSLNALAFGGRLLGSHPGSVQHIVRDNFALVLVARRPIEVLTGMRTDSRVMGSLGATLAVAVFGFALYLYLNGHVNARRAQLEAAGAMLRASRAEKEKELEKRFHALVEASSIGQLVVDETGTILIANHAIEAMFGYAPDELVGQPVEKLMARRSRQAHAALRTGYLEAPEARKMGGGRAFEGLRKDGSRVRVELGLNPYSEGGRQRVLVNVVAAIAEADRERTAS